ncbi:hypothetical protein ABZT06_42400 [Streptomyces sp. NPDC005483]|uniref:hypothetical protein n=1 Tax=Streptomyces sp. NPDC005483 TaxID=3154882 RepID=UPI0033B22355
MGGQFDSHPQLSAAVSRMRPGPRAELMQIVGKDVQEWFDGKAGEYAALIKMLSGTRAPDWSGLDKDERTSILRFFVQRFGNEYPDRLATPQQRLAAVINAYNRLEPAQRSEDLARRAEYVHSLVHVYSADTGDAMRDGLQQLAGDPDVTSRLTGSQAEALRRALDSHTTSARPHDPQADPALATRELRNLDPLHWPDGVTVTKRSGMVGVYFVATSTEIQAVVKPMWDTSSHYADRFIREVAKVVTPRARVVKWDTPEGQIIEGILPDARSSMVNLVAMHQGGAGQGGPEYFSVMEHVPGNELTRLDAQGLHQFLTDTVSLESVGRLLTADIFLGNYDRMSDYHINYSNLLYDSGSAQLTAIDNATYFGGLAKDPDSVSVNLFGIEDRHKQIPLVSAKFVNDLVGHVADSGPTDHLISPQIIESAQKSITHGASGLFSRIGSEVEQREHSLRRSHELDVPYEGAWQPDQWMIRGFAHAVDEIWGNGLTGSSSPADAQAEPPVFAAMMRLKNYVEQHWRAADTDRSGPGDVTVYSADTGDALHDGLKRLAGDPDVTSRLTGSQAEALRRALDSHTTSAPAASDPAPHAFLDQPRFAVTAGDETSTRQRAEGDGKGAARLGPATTGPTDTASTSPDDAAVSAPTDPTATAVSQPATSRGGRENSSAQHRHRPWRMTSNDPLPVAVMRQPMEFELAHLTSAHHIHTLSVHAPNYQDVTRQAAQHVAEHIRAQVSYQAQLRITMTNVELRLTLPAPDEPSTASENDTEDPFLNYSHVAQLTANFLEHRVLVTRRVQGEIMTLMTLCPPEPAAVH